MTANGYVVSYSLGYKWHGISWDGIGMKWNGNNVLQSEVVMITHSCEYLKYFQW